MKICRELAIFEQNKNDHNGRCYFWWGTAYTNRAENKQRFADLIQRVKEFREKWLISPEGEN